MQSERTHKHNTPPAGSQQQFLRRKAGSDRDEARETPFLSTEHLVQPKLTIGRPGDQYEQEADATADRVMRMMEGGGQATPPAAGTQNGVTPPAETAIQRMPEETPAEEPEDELSETPEPAVQRLPEEADIEEEPADETSQTPEPDIQRMPEDTEENVTGPETDMEETPDLQRTAEEEDAEPEEAPLRRQASPGDVPPISPDFQQRLQQQQGQGQSLAPDIQLQMGNALGTDLSGVRVHTDSAAVQMSREINAQAFTHGSDVYFNAGKYDPGSGAGKRLLAHELVHVGQQGGGASIVQMNKQEPKIKNIKRESPLAVYRRVSFEEAKEILLPHPQKLLNRTNWVSQNRGYVYDFPWKAGTDIPGVKGSGSYDVMLQINLKPGAVEWLEGNAIKKVERGSVNYGIPKNKIQEFNNKYIKNITTYSTQPTVIRINGKIYSPVARHLSPEENPYQLFNKNKNGKNHKNTFLTKSFLGLNVINTLANIYTAIKLHNQAEKIRKYSKKQKLRQSEEWVNHWIDLGVKNPILAMLSGDDVISENVTLKLYPVLKRLSTFLDLDRLVVTDISDEDLLNVKDNLYKKHEMGELNDITDWHDEVQGLISLESIFGFTPTVRLWDKNEGREVYKYKPVLVKPLHDLYIKLRTGQEEAFEKDKKNAQIITLKKPWHSLGRHIYAFSHNGRLNEIKLDYEPRLILTGKYIPDPRDYTESLAEVRAIDYDTFGHLNQYYIIDNEEKKKSSDGRGYVQIEDILYILNFHSRPL